MGYVGADELTAEDVQGWQLFEIEGLREYCHEANKDFYVIDGMDDIENNCYKKDISLPSAFIRTIIDGYSCVRFARECAGKMKEHEMERTPCILTDGDKTLSIDDSTAAYGYATDIFSGNFYTGYQSWLHDRAWKKYVEENNIIPSDISGFVLRPEVYSQIKGNSNSAILTSGNLWLWNKIGDKLSVPVFGGAEMSADTKYFIAKFIRRGSDVPWAEDRSVRNVVAYGDSMNDYFMLKEADEGYVVPKPDGKLSSSFRNRDVKELNIVIKRMRHQ